MMDNARIERARSARSLLIGALALAWITTGFFMRVPDHPNDYEPRRHRLVAEALVQEPSPDDDLEWKLPAVWYEATSDSFYSIYDAWNDRMIDTHNKRKKALNYGVALLIALVVVVSQLRLHSLGVRPAYSTNRQYRRWQQILARPVVFSALTILLATSAAFFLDHLGAVRARRTAVVGAMVHDRALHERFLAGHFQGSTAWRRDLAKSIKVTFPEGGVSASDE